MTSENVEEPLTQHDSAPSMCGPMAEPGSHAASKCCGGAVCSRSIAGNDARFTLSVRVLSASLPTLVPPSMLLMQQLFVEISWGRERRETMFAVHTGAHDLMEGMNCGSPCIRASADSDRVATWPWRFNDTFLFAATLEDLLGPGIHVRLKVTNEIQFGFTRLQVSQVREIGSFSLDVRHTVLPACSTIRPDFVAGGAVGDVVVHAWGSPTLVVPLVSDRRGVLRLSSQDNAAGHVALSFSTTVDPQELERCAANADWCALGQKLTSCKCCQQQRQPGARIARPKSNTPDVVASRTLARDDHVEAVGRNTRISPSFGAQRRTQQVSFECGQVSAADSPRGSALPDNSPTLLSKLSVGQSAHVDSRCPSAVASKTRGPSCTPFRTI